MTDIVFRDAAPADLAAIVSLLADDALGRQRENLTRPLDPAYVAAFEAIAADANQRLIVAVDGDTIAGTLQLSFIPGISRRGAWRGQIEAVRVAASRRGTGLGRQMIEWAVAQCAARGCSLVQLTTDKTRPDAQRFYASLGFVASHEGLKRQI